MVRAALTAAVRITTAATTTKATYAEIMNATKHMHTYMHMYISMCLSEIERSAKSVKAQQKHPINIAIYNINTW